jgi:arylsulfatase A-like enzyme
MTADNVILIVLDTTRYGVTTDSSVAPNLHRIKTECTSYAAARANAPWTLPSHASMFTGEYPSEHEIGANYQYDPDDGLVEELNEAGYNTAGFTNNPWITPEFGFDQFDQFYAGWRLLNDQRGRERGDDPLSQGIDGARRRVRSAVNDVYSEYVHETFDSGAFLTNKQVKHWLRRHREDPFFLYVNYMEPHLEYDPRERYVERFVDDVEAAKNVNQDPWAYLCGREEMTERDFELLRGLYAAEVNYMDERLGRLWDYLRRKGILRNTNVVVVGDHGENLGEHGLMDHQYSLHNTVTHVPLHVYAPGDTDDESVERLTELRQLYHEMRSMAGLGSADAVEADEERDRAISEYLTPQPAVEELMEHYDVGREDVGEYDRALRAIETDRWKYVESDDGERRLYETTGDLAGRTDVSESHPDVADRLGAELDDELGALHRLDELDQNEVNERLESLGYI